MTDKYIFDDACGKVHMFSAEHDAYLFECTYLQARITSRMSEAKQIAKVEKWKAELEDWEEHMHFCR